MKKQIAIATVAIMLMAVLIVPTVMAFAVRDGNSVQYFSHRGLNYITDNSSASMNEKLATNLGGTEWRVPGKIIEGVIEGVPKGKIIKGTPENPEQVILY